LSTISVIVTIWKEYAKKWSKLMAKISDILKKLCKIMKNVPGFVKK